MTSKNEIKTLGELSVDNKGSYGIAASAVEYSEDLYTYLRISDITDDGRINKNDLKSVKEQNAKDYLLKPNDIVFARTGGSTGRNYFYDGKDGQFVYAGFLIKFSINPQKVNPKYIKYYCQSKIYRDWVHSFNTGSTRGNINAQTYSQLPIILPPRTQQDILVKMLSSLDDKIELNNKINQNLEQQAQAIFKSWFVDFEPFDGKMPDDWKIGTISELGTVVGGSTPSKKNPEYYTNNGIAWITPKDLSRKNLKFISKGEIDITDKGFKNSSVTIMPKGTVLFSSRAPIGYISIAQNDVTTNQGFKSVIPFQTVGTPYVYLYLKNNITLIENMAAGSTFKEVSGSIMQNIPALIPSKKILKRFNTLCDKIFRKQEYLEVENEKLTQLRDTLLPKLMSGEIDVDKVEI